MNSVTLGHESRVVRYPEDYTLDFQTSLYYCATESGACL